MNPGPDPVEAGTMRASTLLSSLLLALVLPTAARTFTNHEGATINAEVKSATATTVTLQLSTGKLSTITLDLLSEADQDFIRTWRATQLPDVRITPTFVRSNRDPRDASSTSIYEKDSRQVQVLDLSVHLETWDQGQGIENGELQYILVGRSTAKRGRYKILAVQQADFKLPPAGETEVKFKRVQNFYDDGSYKKGARCIGYVLYAKRKSDGREIHASASSPVLKKAIYSIIALKTGEETDNNFVKLAETSQPRKKKKDDVITVK